VTDILFRGSVRSGRNYRSVPDGPDEGWGMVQKVSEVVGTSTESFAKAADNAVVAAARTVRHLRWFRVTELEGQVRDQKVSEYKVTLKIYFDIEE
jgi:flavin-binding protein dodecin